jgi:hypothetical protein
LTFKIVRERQHFLLSSCFAREARIDADKLIGTLIAMSKQLPDEANAALSRAREEGLAKAIVERLVTQLIERADDCRRLLGVA